MVGARAEAGEGRRRSGISGEVMGWRRSSSRAGGRHGGDPPLGGSGRKSPEHEVGVSGTRGCGETNRTDF
jgi:hypothetical protein